MFENILPDADGERAVSPVIGVILMVAITVILAAVIGTFVLGLGDQVSQTAPQASISVESVSNSIDDSFTLSHGGGDSIAAGETDIAISSGGLGGTSSATLSADSSIGSDLSTAEELQIIGGANDGATTGSGTDAVWPSGTGTYSGANVSFSPGDEFTVTLVDTASGQIIAEKNVEA